MILATTLTIASAPAFAGIHCFNPGKEINITTHASRVSENPFNKLVFMKEKGETIIYYGISEIEPGALYSIAKIQLYDSLKILVGVLNISSQPKNCGRGSCDIDSGKVLTAQLQMGNENEYFSCSNYTTELP